jgi:hypothetical protein
MPTSVWGIKLDLHEAKLSLGEYGNALAVLQRILNDILLSEGNPGEVILALGRPLIAKMDVLARESAELADLINKGIAAHPHYLESRTNEVLEVSAAQQRLKLETDKANEAAERFKKRDSMGEFTIDIEQAKAFRNLERRFFLLEGKRLNPTENGRLTAAEIVEAREVSALMTKAADAFVCSGYVSNDHTRDSNRLHQLDCKRMSPGQVLSNAEDDEDARLSVRVAAYWRSPRGRDSLRMRELFFKRLRGCCSVDEEKELDHLESLYPKPENPGPESPQLKAIRAMIAERKQQRSSKHDADRR